ncbi:1079_t:CDS:1, partial [Paraglomus brasilianum]
DADDGNKKAEEEPQQPLEDTHTYMPTRLSLTLFLKNAFLSRKVSGTLENSRL